MATVLRSPGYGSVSGPGRVATASDRYAVLLAMSLAAYALLGKGYAYAGVPPLFVTELVLASGLLLMLHTGCLLASLASWPAVFLLGVMALTVARTVPFIGIYGVDAIRDSVLALYGLFALITVALLLERPARIAAAARFLEWFTTVFVFTVPVVYALNAAGILKQLPGWPAAHEPLIAVRAGEIGVHVCGCALMGLLGLRPVTRAWTAVLLLDIMLVVALSRGGMLSIIVPLALAVVMSGRWRQVARIGACCAALLAVLYVANVTVPLHQSNGRDLDVRQMVDNLTSVAGSANRGDLDDDKAWRLMWWSKIEDYTFSGPYFWSGKGFGVNLADSDGFQGTDLTGPPLRSPHNSHLTMLARTGVPGFALWVLLGGTWLAMMTAGIRLARRNGDEAWANLILLTMGYWLAIVIDASFDVALEAPMLGVWFWCLFGFGVGCVMIYKAALGTALPPRRRNLRVDLPACAAD